jgi:hypothetical protein
MYLSADRLALANQTIKETFEQSSVAFQAFPNWDTRDPSQTMVRKDNVTGNPDYLTLQPLAQPFEVSLAEAIAPTHDAVIAKVIANTAILAASFDAIVIPALHSGTISQVTGVNATDVVLHDKLIEARAVVETGGYRAESAIITNTIGLQALSQLNGGYSIMNSLLGPANVNSVYRVNTLEPASPTAPTPILGYLVGRRQRIPQGGASEASAGEEPVDIALSVPPSLEVVGDTANNTIKLIVRVTFATRVKDQGGLVAFVP